MDLNSCRDVVFIVSGSQQSILKSERLVSNVMQRMSGIATITREYVDIIKGLHAKNTWYQENYTGMRFAEKEAVRIERRKSQDGLIRYDNDQG